jgi:hypothetical protein
MPNFLLSPPWFSAFGSLMLPPMSALLISSLAATLTLAAACGGKSGGAAEPQPPIATNCAEAAQHGASAMIEEVARLAADSPGTYPVVPSDVLAKHRGELTAEFEATCRGRAWRANATRCWLETTVDRIEGCNVHFDEASRAEVAASIKAHVTALVSAPGQ